MRFRPANIRLINRRSNMLRLLLALSSRNSKSNRNDKNNPTDSQGWTGSLHIRDLSLIDELAAPTTVDLVGKGNYVRTRLGTDGTE